MLRNRWIKVLLFILCLSPVGWLGWQALHDNLTANPIEYITHFTGDWTIRFIILTLAVTPLRRLLRLPDLVRFRRMLGLYAFFYGVLHFLTWFWLDKYFDMHEILQDVLKRRFVTVGFLALLLMLPLAITSTKGWIKRLGGKRWQLLHRLVYVSAIAGVVHYYWLVKSDIRLPALYGSLVLLLLVARLFGSRSAKAANFTTLQLASIQRQTSDAVTLRFPLNGKMQLGAKPGQFLTFDWVVSGKKLPRSYSISSSPLRTDYVEVTVKQQGVVSSFLNSEAKPGLMVDVHGPFGQFYFDEKQHRSVVLFAGGSGITPILSMLRYIEEVAADTAITLFYAVRGASDIIFRDELDRLRALLPRFRCVMIASRPAVDWDGPHGHISRALVEQHLTSLNSETYFLCGPAAFMASVHEILSQLGVSPEQIRQERFTIGMPHAASQPATTYTIEFAKSGKKCNASSANSLLAIAESNGIEIESSCRVGQCGTCATRVLAGDIEMETEEGLDPKLRAQGYRLLCVGRALSNITLEA